MSAFVKIRRPLPAGWAFIGRLFRALPHFQHKWRVCAKIIGPWVRGRGYSTVVTFDRGQRIRVDLDEWIQYQIFLTGYYDVETRPTCLFRRIVQEGMTVIDVGANVGYYTLQAAARVGRTGQVHAFEPASATFARLVENISLNRFENIVARQAIVHDRGGRHKLFVAGSDNTGQSGLRSPPGFRSVEQVEAVILDDYCASAGLRRVDVVKIDVEGNELAVLRGMPDLLAQPQLQLLVEINASTLRATDTRPSDLFGFLGRYGFRAFRAGRRSVVPLAESDILGKESLALFRKP